MKLQVFSGLHADTVYRWSWGLVPCLATGGSYRDGSLQPAVPIETDRCCQRFLSRRSAAAGGSYRDGSLLPAVPIETNRYYRYRVDEHIRFIGFDAYRNAMDCLKSRLIKI